ncbi:MAG: DHH family phosphoesterase [Thermoprotei archaeon]|nr:DHH family phosphoesterase [Thermoprotei archaeon]
MSAKRLLDQGLDEAVEALVEWSKSGKPALLISHYDADGITSASIMIKVLNDLAIPFHVKIVNQLDEPTLRRLEKLLERHEFLIFTDLGSGQRNLLSRYADKNILVVDHHQPIGGLADNVKAWIEVNPRLYDINGNTEACASTMSYLIARRLSSSNISLAPIAIVGALGDMQDCGEKGQLVGLNRRIVEEGVKSGYVSEEMSLRLFGLRSKPLVECIARTTNPYIPGLTGNERASYKFLKSIGIEPEVNGQLRMFSSLSKEEVRKLVTGLIKYMIDVGLSSKEAERIIGYVYLFPREKPESPLFDAREYSSLVNACGRLDKYGVAIAVCLGDREESLKEAIQVANMYRERLGRYIRLVVSGEIVEEYEGFYCIHGDIVGIEEKIIGTIASIAASATLLPKGKPVIALTRAEKEGFIKVSARLPRALNRKGIDLARALRFAAEKVGGAGGGHEVAAGAQIPIERKREFLELLGESLYNAK